MARRPKNGKSGETEVVATTLLMPSEKKLEALLKLARNTKKRAQSIAGEFGAEIAKAVDDHHLDRKAFSIARTLDALDDEKLHVTYAHLMEYLDKLGIAERALAQGDMFENDKEEPEASFADSKVTSLPPRKVAETAGA